MFCLGGRGKHLRGNAVITRLFLFDSNLFRSLNADLFIPVLKNTFKNALHTNLERIFLARKKSELYTT